MRSTVSATEAVQAPVALASARAVITRRWPRSITASRQISRRSARTQRAPVRITAPRSAASTAVSTTSRELSTTQSEYSNAVPNGRFSALPTGWWVMSMVAERRQAAARGQPVVEQQPRAQQPGRPLVGMGGDRKPHRAHQMRRDPQPDVALASARSAPAERPGAPAPTRSPWISRGEAEDAAAPRSPCSSRITRRPRPAASRAMLTPFKPPPMIARS